MSAHGWILTSLALLLGSTAHAQTDKEYKAHESLYATAELIEGGSPLHSVLFAKGWPTDEPHRKLCFDLAGGPGEELLLGYLGSKFGPSVVRSDYLLSRRELRTKSGDEFETNDELLGDDLRVYRHLSGFRSSTSTFQPILFPYQSGTRKLRRGYSRDDLNTWSWRGGEGKHTLEAFGYAILAETRYARVQLSTQRTETQGGKEVKLYGRDARGGMMGLTALAAACAKVWELRTQLILDQQKKTIGPKQGLGRLDVRRYSFPQAWTSEEVDGLLRHKVAESDGGNYRSRLRSLSAILRGVSALTRLASKGSNKAIGSLFEQQQVRNKRVFLFHPEIRRALVEVVCFAFQSIRTNHISVADGARAATLALGKGGRGNTITPSDLGMFLVALEEFVHIPTGKGMRDKELLTKLTAEQSKARALTASLAEFMASWVRDSNPGVFDKYGTEEGAPLGRSRSLLSQGMCARGLLAAHRVNHSGKLSSPALQAARRQIRLLDERFWDSKTGAYVSKGKRASLHGAASILAALREMALETGDGRYLLRYRQYLERLHASGWYENPVSTTPAGLLGETSFSSIK